MRTSLLGPTHDTQSWHPTHVTMTRPRDLSVSGHHTSQDRGSHTFQGKADSRLGFQKRECGSLPHALGVQRVPD